MGKGDARESKGQRPLRGTVELPCFLQAKAFADTLRWDVTCIETAKGR
jgi:hypothetical protein